MTHQAAQEGINLMRFVGNGHGIRMSPDVAGRSYALDAFDRSKVESQTVMRLARTGLFAFWNDHRDHLMSGIQVLGVMVVDYTRTILAEGSPTIQSHGQREIVAPTSDYQVYLGGRPVRVNATWQKQQWEIIVDIVANAVQSSE